MPQPGGRQGAQDQALQHDQAHGVRPAHPGRDLVGHHRVDAEPGGQRQRLCIARVLLQKPAVMLLDEATSHLDSDTEAALREVLDRVSRRCAVIAIAHRISTVVD
ncbi:ATP-binding cassette domain-containing protein, partial [Vibrio vulnificus]|nr:ATP-binding cassette domain-containing protein [Vibrio vulnificus]